MTKRALVISGDVLPLPGYPTTGAGLRAWGLGQGLRAHGFEVVFAMPRIAQRPQAVAPLDFELLWWEGVPHQVEALVRQARPDAVVFCHWPAMSIHRRFEVPTVIDFHGPHLLERAFQGYGLLGANVVEKIEAVRKADYFICAAEKQKFYFLAWLLASGIDVTEPCLGVVPVFLSPELPARKMPSGEPLFVYGGVYLPWQNPSLGLMTVAEVLAQRNRGLLRIFAGKHPNYPIEVPSTFLALEDRLKDNSRTRFEGLRPHHELLEVYADATAAVDLMAHNYERELAFTTRTVEYMWCGLPVIYNDYAELSPLIARYEAGWVLDPADQAGLEEVVHGILDHPEQAYARGQRAQQLVREHLTWDRAIIPLVNFLRDPKIRTPRELDVAAFVALQFGVRDFWSRDLAAHARSPGSLINAALSYYRQGGLPRLARQSLYYAHQTIRERRAKPRHHPRGIG